MKKTNERIYLDDERIPKGKGYTIIRSYDEFVRHIKENGMPKYISFDHDIASFDGNNTEKTGLDAAKFIVSECMANSIKCPEFNVHSANPVGAENIIMLLTNFTNFQNTIKL